MIYRIEDNLAPTLNLITLPVSLLSGIILPLALAPTWLKTWRNSTRSHAVDASRLLFMGNYGNIEILEGYVIITLLALAMFWWSTRSLGKMAE